jgi:multiple sugar transport system permease protein
LTQLEVSAQNTIPKSRFGNLFSGRRGRNLREYLTGYALISPAVILVFIFGIFPVGFALFVSVHKWRLRRGDVVGLDNYSGALGNLAYLAFFALGLGAFALVYILVKRIRTHSSEHQDSTLSFALVGAITAGAFLSFLRWFVVLLPEVLDIANKIIGIDRTQAIFFRFLGEAFVTPDAFSAFFISLLLIIASVVMLLTYVRRLENPRKVFYLFQYSFAWIAAAVGLLLTWFAYYEAARAYRMAIETGGDPGIWPQVITIGTGVILLAIAWLVWRSSENQDSNRSFSVRLLGALFLMIGGWLLIGELPIVIAAGDPDLWSGLKVTIFYSLGTVPFQLTISLFLAVLIFQKLAGSELFRMMYFMPYVTPFVASAAVFKSMFSVRPAAPANQVLDVFGLEPQQWLQESTGVLAMLGEKLGFVLPEWAAGPSLALVVIMMYSIWVYVGYDTVIYLAGLGNISSELTEAAEIDGAGRWQVFRHIVFPLLSPTTYFLSLIAIIGTFKAFAHIWVMRHEFSVGTVNTFSVTIFLEFFEKLRFGYASALAFVLFAIILTLTLINNRIQGTRVFYG